MGKRITLRMLEEMDKRDVASRVRRLEMAVDGCVTTTAYSMQFWNDVRLYGIREALLYLQRCNCLVPQAKVDNCAGVEKLVKWYEAEFALVERMCVMEIENPKYYEIIIAGEMKFVVVLDKEDKPEVFCANLGQTINKSVDWNEFYPDW